MFSFDYIKIAQYRFTFIPDDFIIMPEKGKGNVIRGAFGTTLKRICCINQNLVDCKDCLDRSRCAYHFIFNPVNLISQKRMRDTPRGFVVKPPLALRTEYTKEVPFVFYMVLVGKLIDFIPWLIVPMSELGKFGIGKNRRKFILGDVSMVFDDINLSLYDPKTRIFKNHGDYITGESILKKAEKLSKYRITMEFLTPTRIKYNLKGTKGSSTLIKEPEFHHIFRRLLGRISSISLAYFEKPIDIDYEDLTGKALNIKKIDENLNWVGLTRKSKTEYDRFNRHTIHDQSGFVGKMTFGGDFTEFLPFLVLGEYLHVGDDTVFGNGWYRLVNE